MVTEIEFDREGLEAKVAHAALDVLRRMGAYIRKVARSKVHLSPKASQALSPPHSRRGLLKRAILFGVEKREQRVLIGPGFRFVGTSAAAHEFGGGYRGNRYPKRPLMGPSLKDSAPHLAKLWQDAVK
jgi:hypothetical protein